MNKTWSRKRKAPGDPPDLNLSHHRGPRGQNYIDDDKKRGSSLYSRKMSLVKKAIEFRNTTHKDVFIEMVTDSEHVVYGSPAMLKRYNTNVKLSRTIQTRLTKDGVTLPKEPLTDGYSKMLDQLPVIGGPPTPNDVSPEDKTITPSNVVSAVQQNMIHQNGEITPDGKTECAIEITPSKVAKKGAKTVAASPRPVHKHGTRSRSRASVEDGPKPEDEVIIKQEPESPTATKADNGSIPQDEVKEKQDESEMAQPDASTSSEQTLDTSEDAEPVQPPPCVACGQNPSAHRPEQDEKAIQCSLIPIKPSYANKCRICNNRYFRKDKVSEWVGCAHIEAGQMCDYWVHVKCTGYNYKIAKSEMEIHYFCPQHIQ